MLICDLDHEVFDWLFCRGYQHEIGNLSFCLKLLQEFNFGALFFHRTTYIYKDFFIPSFPKKEDDFFPASFSCNYLFSNHGDLKQASLSRGSVTT